MVCLCRNGRTVSRDGPEAFQCDTPAQLEVVKETSLIRNLEDSEGLLYPELNVNLLR